MVGFWTMPSAPMNDSKPAMATRSASPLASMLRRARSSIGPCFDQAATPVTRSPSSSVPVTTV